MPDVVQIVQAGAVNPWFYLPVAIVLGALHALEPGHAKSLMAAFIEDDALAATRGTASRQRLRIGLTDDLAAYVMVAVLCSFRERSYPGLWCD